VCGWVLPRADVDPDSVQDASADIDRNTDAYADIDADIPTVHDG
jgi:hypothetical protein